MAVINTNLTSMVSQQNLGKSKSALATSMERLSSGLRINSAKDDAAGQAIGNRIQAQRTGLGQSARNANDGVSLSQTAQGVLSEVNDRLQRIRELTVQGLNGINQNRDSDSIQAEINFNLQEIDRLANTSDFNGIPLMTGQAGRVDLQVGANDGQTIGVDLSPPGFTVDALGLTDFNVAGEPGSVTPRDTLYGPADDIVLEDFRTTVNYPAGAQETLYAIGDVALAGDHQQEPGAISTYYVSTGGGNFSRVDVSATHETATDLSVVNVTNPQPIYKTDWQLDDTFISGLAANERVVKADDRYFIQTDSAGSLSYREAEFEISFTGTALPTATVQGGAVLAGNYQPATAFTFDSVDYDLADFNDTYQTAGGSPLPGPELVEDSDNPGAFYLKSTDGSDVAYYRLDDIDVLTNLDVDVDGPRGVPTGGTETTVNTFDVGGQPYDISSAGGYNAISYGTPNPIDRVVSYDDGGGNVTFYAVDTANNYFEITGAEENKDMILQADSQAYSGIDVEGQASSPAAFVGSVTRTPEVPDFSTATPDFQNDISGITNPQLIRSTSNDQWIIQGDLPGGGYGYYNANLEVTLDEQGNPSGYTATATQAEPTILGVDEHVVDKVHGTSTVTIDPRNVSVEYTDIEGRTYSNVLTEGEDGNYYFELPGESSLRGGYKTATLVDHDQKGEIILRTENGYSEVVVFYPTELEKGINRAFYVQTDGDGFGDDGTPHTRLRIQEVGEDFRIQMPRNPLAALDKAIGMVDSKRSYLGALDNRLGSIIEANDLTAMNLASAQSRIVDADYAVEVANMTKAQILQQAGTSVLAQANQIPQNVLSLLG